jgi:hypothetical protein
MNVIVSTGYCLLKSWSSGITWLICDKPCVPHYGRHHYYPHLFTFLPGSIVPWKPFFCSKRYFHKMKSDRIYSIHPSIGPPPLSPVKPRSPIIMNRFRVELLFRVGLYNGRPPLRSTGQSFWLQIQRSRVWFRALPDFLRSSGSGRRSTQPREDNWGSTWSKSSGSGLENRD